MSANAPPSIDPADTDSLPGVLRAVLGKFLQNVDDMLPATVMAYDRDTNRAQVQPLIKILSTAGDTISRAPVASVPVFQIGGGGFILNFNLKPGDLGWIKASDRDISLFLQAYSESRPNTLRKHSFSDALFFPDVMRGYTIAGEDAENAVLQTLDGTVRVALWPDRIKLTAPQVILNTALTTATGAMVVEGLITAQAGLSASPAAGGGPAISCAGDAHFIGTHLLHNGINVGDTHEHELAGTTTGSLTGPPQ